MFSRRAAHQTPKPSGTRFDPVCARVGEKVAVVRVRLAEHLHDASEQPLGASTQDGIVTGTKGGGSAGFGARTPGSARCISTSARAGSRVSMIQRLARLASTP